MGKKRRFSRFMRWIKSDLPIDNKSVLLLGVTKLPSPTAVRARPHTLHLDHYAQPVVRTRSNASLTVDQPEPRQGNGKKVSFVTGEPTHGPKRLGFCTELPYGAYHPVEGAVADAMDRSVDSIGSCSLDVDASSTDFSDSSLGSSDCTLRSLGAPIPTTHAVEPKKPSYLNLACTVNGYSTITNYDSKARDNFRIPKSREISPIRPQEVYHANIATDRKFLTPNYTKPVLTSPKMAESKSHTVLQSSYNSSTATYVSLYSSSSTTFASSSTTSYASKSVLTNDVQTNGTHSTTSSKSFVQQRVERLYGPGALAQGFFIPKRTKDRLSQSEGNALEESVDVQSTSCPTLPVLRHLRPEFRAQLTILSPKRTGPCEKSAGKTNGVEQRKVVVNGTKAFARDKELIENHAGIQNNVAEKLLEEIPAAPQVILPISNGNEASVNGCVITSKCKEPQVKDGRHFLKILKCETERLLGLAERAEAWLEEKKSELEDDVLGYLRSASGKARLLVTQKMQQFEGLCHKNINQIEGEPFPTTPEDLQGFWDMVMLQVTQVDELFAELDALRENNWVVQEKPKSDTVDAPPKPKKVITVKKVVSASAEAQRKQREAARKQMLEDRRKAMRNKPTQSIEIFVPELS